MSDNPIISVSGLRGILGKSLHPALAAQFAAAFVCDHAPGDILISRDGRSTGPMIVRAVAAGLAAAGRNVIDAGVAATPTLGVLIRHHQAAGGVQVSASHNPPEYNGLKLFDDSGRVLTASAGEKVLERFNHDQFGWVDYDRVGSFQSLDETTDAHLQLVLSTVNVERIRSKQYMVLLDANHGSGAVLGRKLLENLGCQAVIIGEEPTGAFIHRPEPTETNLVGISKQVVDSNAVVGFCQDPDADRLALIDEAGRYIGEELTVAITVAHRLHHESGPIVTNCATSRMAQTIAESKGAEFSRSAVGEANVTDEMIRINAIYGGEGNGGPIDPRVGFVRDSFVGMAQVLDAMAMQDQSLSGIVDAIPKYSITKSQCSVEGLDLTRVLDALKETFSDASASALDGLRLDWSNSWLLVRASNTEPIVRIIAEAESGDESSQLVERAKSVIDQLG